MDSLTMIFTITINPKFLYIRRPNYPKFESEFCLLTKGSRIMPK